MALRRLIFALALAATPVLAQDVSSSAPAIPDSSSSTDPSGSAPLEPTGLDDAGLELAVRAAYTGASTFAAAHGNYFTRDGVFAPLRDAIAAELIKQGFAAVTVPANAFDDLAAAKTCLLTPGAELRIVTNTYGDGLLLLAVTGTRDFAYAYDPHKAADIVVTRTEDCTQTP